MTETPILVIDDDDSLRRVIEFTLEEAGYRVLAAADAEAGLKIFHRENPPLVITDIQMPGMSGYEVLKRVRSESPETLVIVITAFGTVDQAVSAMKDGAFDYITKPFSRDALRLTVAKALSFRGLREENQELRRRLGDQVEFEHLIGISERMQDVFEVVRRVAPSDTTIMIYGESGTGKELIARAIHHGSNRREQRFVPVNCAAIPRDLLESELFGHVKGAFTGAVKDRQGKFELADGGTLFLDEVGELPFDLQAKLLRVLQEKEIEPVGAVPRRVDARVVAATNRDLEAAMTAGEFREDLYYRLAVIPLHLPALRERSDDIRLLIRHFLEKHGAGDLKVSQTAQERLEAYDWPGNVRELENVIERAILLRRGEKIDEEDLPQKISENSAGSHEIVRLPAEGYPLEEIEKQAILQALNRHRWNQTRAAAFLRIPRHVLLYRMEKYDLKKPSG